MILQLDAAQVIDLIDEDASRPEPSELRSLLLGHICAISSSVLLDLRRKNDRPLERYYSAFRGMKLRWGIDAGMICNKEILGGVTLLGDGRSRRSDLEKAFPFRDSILEAISVRLGVAVPPEFANKGFGDILGDHRGRAIFNFVAVAWGIKQMERWTNELTMATQEQPPTLRAALMERARKLCGEESRDKVEGASDEVLSAIFPAFALMTALRRLAHSDRKTKWTHNDVVDLFHAPLAPYCDAAFFDGPAARRLRRAQKEVPIATRIIDNSEAVGFLRENRTNAEGEQKGQEFFTTR